MYIFYTVTTMDVIEQYTQDDTMYGVGESYRRTSSIMQLDNNNLNDRKKVSIQYHCNIRCLIDSVAIDE